MIFLTIAVFIVNFVLGFIAFILGLRIVLKMIGAGTQASFVSWVYKTSQPLLGPFQGIYPTVNLGPFVFEPASIIAFVVYAVAGLLVNQVIQQSRKHAVKKQPENK